VGKKTAKAGFWVRCGDKKKNTTPSKARAASDCLWGGRTNAKPEQPTSLNWISKLTGMVNTMSVPEGDMQSQEKRSRRRWEREKGGVTRMSGPWEEKKETRGLINHPLRKLREEKNQEEQEACLWENFPPVKSERGRWERRGVG